MKIPKLKYYYYAMTSDAYIDFATTRKLDVEPAVKIDLLTGAITGRTHLNLCSSALIADADFRLQHNNYTQPVYVLRIAREHVNRSRLEPITEQVWRYRSAMTIPHCGVERIEYDPASAVEVTKQVDAPNMFTIQL